MLPSYDIAVNLSATVLTATAVCVPGYALARWLPEPIRARDGFATWPLLGIAYWAAMLYLLPFRGGLLLAGLSAVLSLVISGVFRRKRLLRRRPKSRTQRRARRVSAVILGLGCAVYLTPLFNKHVPDGMDAARYIMNTRLIAAQAGLPETLAPFAPEIPFGAANHGLPAVAAIAVLGGATPAAATLACVPLAYTCLILATYLLIRLAASRTAAAIIAVSVCWLAKQTQQDLLWGGYTGVCTLALGALAARILIEALRGRQIRAAPAGGFCIGALPILHGCMAAGWLYIVAPVTTITGLLISRCRRKGLATLLMIMMVAGVIVSAYAATAWTTIDEATRQWIITNELHDKFSPTGWQALLEAPRYLSRAAGTTLTLLFGISCAILTAGRSRRILAGIAGVLTLNLLTIINAGYGFLPATLLLYPSRLREFPTIGAGLVVALAWRVLPRHGVIKRRLGPPLAGLLLFVALLNHGRYYQSTASQPTLPEGAWHALNWCAENLNPSRDYVATVYGTAGAYLPGVAGIAATNWHAHIIDQSATADQMRRTRPVTHIFLIEKSAIRSAVGRCGYDRDFLRWRKSIEANTAVRVFTKGAVTLYKLAPRR